MFEYNIVLLGLLAGVKIHGIDKLHCADTAFIKKKKKFTPVQLFMPELHLVK